jgi:hypothetical protein
LFLWYPPLSAQKNNTLLSDSTDLYSLVQKEYGPDQVLINGLYPEDYVRDAIGHPFFQDNKFYPGYIILHNQKFDDVSLKYNIFDQNIIVSQPVDENNTLQIIPPNKFITEFRVNDKLFRKFCFDGANEKFFQVIYDGDIKCLYSITKKRFISYHTQKFSSFKFSKEIRDSYLLIDQKLYRYNTLGSILRHFPDKTKPEIKAFCKKERIRLSKSSDQEIRKLIEFCEN